MSRFIDVDRIDWRLIIPTNVTIAEENMIHLAKKLVERQPTVDAVEVVRCKDCTRQMICFHSDDYFCADGERREDDKRRNTTSI